MTIRVAIVDDEAIARRRLMRLLSAEPDVEVVAECPTGRSAIDAIRTATPDLVLLDVQLPDIDGFGVLKPFDTERFQTAFRRARAHIDQVSSAELGRRLKALVENQFGLTPEQSIVATEPRPGKYISRLTVRRDGRVVFVRVAEVDWFEAAGNYVRLHVGKNASLLRETMHGLEASLDPAVFVRIHRTIIVNVDRIQELQPWFAGNYVVILRDGTRLKLSRTYRDRLPLHGRRSR
jgi:two-component system LytT family response regulator